MNRSICVGLLVLGTCLLASAQFHRSSPSARIRVGSDNYECSCSYSCPSYGINAGTCYDNDNDYWRWGGARPSYCCTIDYDTPDRYDPFDNRNDNSFDNTFDNTFDNRFDNQIDNRYNRYDRDTRYPTYDTQYTRHNNFYDNDGGFF